MGNLKCLFLTDADSIVRRDRRGFLLKNGRYVSFKKLKSIVSFYNFKELADIFNIPVIYISEENVVLRNIGYTGYVKNPKYTTADNLIGYALNVFKRTIKDIEIINREYFIEWLFLQRLLANTFFGVTAGVYFRRGVFSVDPYVDVRIGSRKMKLWQILLLPAVSYGIAKEFNNIWLYDVEKFRDAKSCLNAVLSYIFGSPHFSFILRRAVYIGALGGVCKFNHTESHSSLPSYSCKL